MYKTQRRQQARSDRVLFQRSILKVYRSETLASHAGKDFYSLRGAVEVLVNLSQIIVTMLFLKLRWQRNFPPSPNRNRLDFKWWVNIPSVSELHDTGEWSEQPHACIPHYMHSPELSSAANWLNKWYGDYYLVRQIFSQTSCTQEKEKRWPL